MNERNKQIVACLNRIEHHKEEIAKLQEELKRLKTVPKFGDVVINSTGKKRIVAYCEGELATFDCHGMPQQRHLTTYECVPYTVIGNVFKEGG